MSDHTEGKKPGDQPTNPDAPNAPTEPISACISEEELPPISIDVAFIIGDSAEPITGFTIPNVLYGQIHDPKNLLALVKHVVEVYEGVVGTLIAEKCGLDPSQLRLVELGPAPAPTADQPNPTRKQADHDDRLGDLDIRGILANLDVSSAHRN